MGLMSEFFPSRFLKTDELPKNRNATVITGTSRTEVKEEDGTKATRLVLETRDFKPFILSAKVNLATLIRGIGDDETAWVGHPIAYIKSTTTFGSRIVDCTRIEVVDEA